MSSATLARRVSALRQFHKFLYVDRHRADDPAAALEGPRRVRNAPGVLSIAEVDGLLRVSTGRAGRRDASAGRAHARRAHVCAAGDALRHRAARQRTGVAAEKRGAGARSLHRHQGQGRARTDRAADDAREKGHIRLSRAAGSQISGARGLALSVSLGRRQRPSDPPSFCARSENSRGRGGDSRERHSSRMRCATPSPAICCKTAPICASCRNCSATPIFRRRRSTLMCSTSGCARWCAICIRFRTKPVP